MSSLYAQLKLPHPDKQIRLLRLAPSPAGTDDYAFSMEVHDFEEKSRPSYIAMSYTWGPPVPKLPVVINGFRVRVQFNCWYALWQMRHHGYASDVNFWIDSLCINQGDDAEKGHQVAMMGDIYSSASLVAASLGTGESLGNVQEILASGDNYEIGKLRDRFDRLPYFDRVWIKQEILLPRDITFFYGLERLSWSDFDHAVNIIERKYLISQSEDSDSSCGRDSDGRSPNDGKFRDSMRREELERSSISTQLCNHRSQATKTSTVMDLVVKYRSAKASVPADKVYALLSLLPQTDPIRLHLTVAYGQETWFPLFRNLTRLLYSYYEEEHVGDKHTALCLIRDSLGIRGLDDDVNAFLKAQVFYPLDSPIFSRESTSVKIYDMDPLQNEDSGDLDDKELRIGTRQAEPLETVEKLGLFGHEGGINQEYGPGSLNSRDGNRSIPRLHIPQQLKSLRTIYDLTGPKETPLSKPTSRARFLVNHDVEPGDLLAVLVWDVSVYDTKDKWALAYVILRPVFIVDKKQDGTDHVPLDDETGRPRSAFFLHSWAVPVRQRLTVLSRRVGGHSVYASSSEMREKDRVGRLRLHYRDALIPLLLNYHPLQSLLYSHNVANSGDMNFSSRVEDPRGLEDLLDGNFDSEDSRDEDMYGDAEDDSDAGSWQTSEGGN